MRPPRDEDEEPAAVQKTSAVLAADNLPPIDIKIMWDKDEEFAGQEDLIDALKKAKKLNIRHPSTDQKLMQDPRLCPTGEYFRDCVRRQFNCQKLGIDILTLELTYKNITISKGSREKDILRDPWEESKSTFEDEANTDLVIHVQFKAADEPDNIFESFEAPPAVSSLFDVSNGDVERNHGGVDEILIAALGAKTGFSLPPEPSPIGVDTGGLPRFLDLVFGQGGSANEIGSAPKPKKYHGPGAIQALLGYYDGVDVNDEEARRDWQRRLLNEATQNGRIVDVKKDKLPTDFSAQEREAVEVAQMLGEHVAMGQEDDDETLVSASPIVCKSTFH